MNDSFMNDSFSRRTFLGTGIAFPWIATLLNAAEAQNTPKPTPLIHCTDLFHPHGDPDDHFDLACVYALATQGSIDLRGIGLDYPPDSRAGDPDFMAVAQLNRICGLNIPAFVGAAKRLTTKTDTLPDLSRPDSVGIQWIINTLKMSDQPVAITVVGSAADIAVAARREPELFRKKCAGVYLNAGAAHQTKPEILEYNVKLNPAAYAAMFELPCPLYWFPCWNMCEERKSGEWGTFYWMPHQKVFEGVAQPVLSYFWYMFSRSQDPQYLRMLKTPPPDAEWNKVLEGQRGMWSTASLFLLAGLTVTKTGIIVPITEAGNDALFRMEHVKVECDDNGRVTWELSKEPTGRMLFHVLDVPNYPAAMSEAVRTLFRAIPS